MTGQKRVYGHNATVADPFAGGRSSRPRGWGIVSSVVTLAAPLSGGCGW